MITGGEGTGEYAPGDVVTITAAEPVEGMMFVAWTGDIEALESATDPETTLTVPAEPIEIAAHYAPVPPDTFRLIVRSGTGDGNYEEGEVVALVANAPSAGKEFDRWTGDTAAVADVDSASTTITMPAAETDVQATYRSTADFAGTWQRHKISIENTTYSGNPFELEVSATFTHEESGDTITMPGYYAGNDTWKVEFMSTEDGTWNYETESTDSDLDGVTGSVEHTEGAKVGILGADPDAGRKWQFSDGTYALPIALRVEFFSEPGSDSLFTDAAEFMQDNELLLMETRLTEEYGQYEGGRYDFIFDGDWKNHEFDQQIWDRFEKRLEILADHGLGAHIMLYSDDAAEPGWGAKSDTEALLLRYLVARTAAFPIVIYNTGIDIAEYRNQTEINWIGEQVRDNDPYGHPVSSRRGGGSGTYAMSDRTFDSLGHRTAEINVIIDAFEDASVPASMDDAWGENRGSHASKDHRAADIRRAAWKCVVAGGVGMLIRGGGDGGSVTGFYHLDKIDSDMESEQWLKHVNPFIRTELGDTFGAMVPDTSLVSGGYALADSGRNKIVYFLMGEDDRYDSGTGGDITLKLSEVSHDFDAEWFDTRKGTTSSAGTVLGGASRTLTPPSKDDWVLLLTKKN
jgi:hypothetical protein